MPSQKLNIPPPKPDYTIYQMGDHTITMVTHPYFGNLEADVQPPYKYVDTMDPVEIIISEKYYHKLNSSDLDNIRFVEDGVGYDLVYVTRYDDIFEPVYVAAIKRIEQIHQGDFIPVIKRLSYDIAQASAVVTKTIENMLWHGFINYDTTKR